MEKKVDEHLTPMPEIGCAGCACIRSEQKYSAGCGAFTDSGRVTGGICVTQRYGDISFSHQLCKVHERFVTEYGSVACNGIRQSTDAKQPEVVAKASQRTAEILPAQVAK